MKTHSGTHAVRVAKGKIQRSKDPVPAESINDLGDDDFCDLGADGADDPALLAFLASLGGGGGLSAADLSALDTTGPVSEDDPDGAKFQKFMAAIQAGDKATAVTLLKEHEQATGEYDSDEQVQSEVEDMIASFSDDGPF